MKIATPSGALILTVFLTACAQFPELDATRTPGLDAAEYPDLVPLEDILLTSAVPRATPKERESIEKRAAGLRSRARRLSRVTAGPGRGIDRRVARLRQKATQLLSR